MKLGTLLLRNAVIGLTQLEAALRNQVLYGGKLGTNLVELGFVELDLLARTLADLTGLPVATQDMLEAAEPDALALVGPELASSLGVIAMRREGDALAVAVIDPDDTDAIAQLTEHVQMRVASYVVPELRALYYLEKLYGLPRKARFVRTAARDAERRAAAAIDDRRRTQPAGGMVMPPGLTVEPRRRRTSTAPMDLTPVPATISAVTVGERIAAATHRDQIADALVDFGRGRTAAFILFIVRDGNALGWRAHIATGRGLVQQIEDLSLPLGGSSVLQAAHDSATPYRGRSPSSGRPVETRLWTAIGADPAPDESMVVPISVRQRVVNLVYAHGLGGAPLAADVADVLVDLCRQAEEAYVRLIKAHRGG